MEKRPDAFWHFSTRADDRWLTTCVSTANYASWSTFPNVASVPQRTYAYAKCGYCGLSGKEARCEGCGAPLPWEQLCGLR